MASRRIAVLSDVHGFLTALKAVLADIDSLGISEIVVAGDIVNFGPSSPEVVDLLRDRGAQMIRGNHEIELVVPYGTPDASPALMHGPRFAGARWTNERLGPARRAFLSALPDRLMLDARTVVCHGSPRGVRDGVRPDHTDDELRAKFGDDPAIVAFVGHIHQPHVREVPPLPDTDQPVRRFVNAGSVGMNLDGDPRSSYVVAEQNSSDAPDEWRTEIRRLVYDTDAAVREYDNGMRDACPEFVEAFTRQVRTGRQYFGPWVRLTAGLRDDDLFPSLRRFLAENP